MKKAAASNADSGGSTKGVDIGDPEGLLRRQFDAIRELEAICDAALFKNHLNPVAADEPNVDKGKGRGEVSVYKIARKYRFLDKSTDTFGAAKRDEKSAETTMARPKTSDDSSSKANNVNNFEEIKQLFINKLGALNEKLDRLEAIVQSQYDSAHTLDAQRSEQWTELYTKLETIRGEIASAATSAYKGVLSENI